eukprot:7625504-Alexandrium_andersonii.AAC.1
MSSCRVAMHRAPTARYALLSTLPFCAQRYSAGLPPSTPVRVGVSQRLWGEGWGRAEPCST